MRALFNKDKALDKKLERIRDRYEKEIPDDSMVSYSGRWEEDDNTFDDPRIFGSYENHFNWKGQKLPKKKTIREIAKDFSKYNVWAGKRKREEAGIWAEKQRIADKLKELKQQDVAKISAKYGPYTKERYRKEVERATRPSYVPLESSRIIRNVDNPVTGIYKPSQMTKDRVEWLMDYKRKKIREGRINKLTLLAELGELAKLRKKLIQRK